MKFTKMQALGNDYVYINSFVEHVADPCALARQVSDRHFGVGSDGLILIGPSETADFRMRMFNADGSESGMCGNGIRSVGKYVYDRGLTDKTDITVETGSGIKALRLHTGGGVVRAVRVDMGRPLLAPGDIPVLAEGPSFVDRPVEAAGKTWRMTCVNMGNPHAVTFVGDVAALDLERIGPALENHPLFPQRANIEFVQRLDGETLKMRVWERGSGETLACGTGACAALVAAVLGGVCARRAQVRLSGGILDIEWDAATDRVFMTGPAECVFDGVLCPAGGDPPSGL